jgi:thiamine pyrophosphokinase
VESHTNPVIVLSGGEPLADDGDFDLPSGAYVIAADSGLHHAAMLGLDVDLVIGDMDSVEPAVLEFAIQGGSTSQIHPADKDHTDLDLAIEAALARRPDRILIVGSYAGRLDHLLGAMQLLVATAGRVGEITWTDGRTRVSTCRRGRAVVIRGRAGDRVSLLPGMIDATGVSAAGLRWALNGETLPAGSSRGVSNAMIDDRAVISVETGTVLVIHERIDR